MLFDRRWLGEDLVGGLCPGDGPAAFVPAVDERFDRGDEVFDQVKVPRRMAWRVMIPKKSSINRPSGVVSSRCLGSCRVSEAVEV